VIQLLALLGIGFHRLHHRCLLLSVAIADRFELEGAAELYQAIYPTTKRRK